jgi:hypothetical protein
MAFDRASGYGNPEAQGGRLTTTTAGFATYNEQNKIKQESESTEMFTLGSSLPQPLTRHPIDLPSLPSTSAQLSPNISSSSIENALATAHRASEPARNNPPLLSKTIFVASCAELNDPNAMPYINPAFLETPLFGTFEFFPSNIHLVPVCQYLESQFGLEQCPPSATRLYIKKFVLREDKEEGTSSFYVTSEYWDTEILPKILNSNSRKVYLEFGIGFRD